MTETGCAVVLDIENLFYGAAGDRLLQEKGNGMPAIAEALVPYIKQFAERQAPIKKLYGAMSVSPTSGRSTFKTIQQLVGLGFEVTTVAFGPNAADFKIAEQCEMLEKDPNISHVVLATGDGQEPFPSIVQNLLGKGKKVSLIVYDQIPAHFSNREDLLVFQLAPAVRRETSEAVKISTPENVPVSETPVDDSPKAAYRKTIKAMLNGEACSEKHRKIITSATVDLVALRNVDPRRSHGLGNLINLLGHTLPQKGIWISDDEIAALIHALTDFTDLFQKKEVYTLNEQSSFRKTLTS